MKHLRCDMFIIVTKFYTLITKKKKESEETFGNVAVTGAEVLRLELIHSEPVET